MAIKITDFAEIFCKISKIANLPTCFFFYVIDILVGAWFLIWGVLAKIFPIFKTIGKYAWKHIGVKIKKMWYTKWLLDKCYRCPKPKKLAVRKCGGKCKKGFVKTKVPCGIVGSCKEK